MTSTASSNYRLLEPRYAESDFAALRWLNQFHFGNLPSIAASIDALEAALAKLSASPIRFPANERIAEERCPCCDQPVTDGSDPSRDVPYCLACLKPLLPIFGALESFDGGFAICAI